ncbi:MAG: tetratricopeptide repeat protein [Nitrospinae bacterium]|nr:tetratricopeptide repeat protein [Nitrospinota bacterium]
MIRHLTVAFIVLLALGISLAFIPGNTERTLMNMKNREFELARFEFAEQFKAGDRSVAVSAPLTELYTYYGELDKAIAVLKGFLEEHPQDYQANQLLADLYWDAQRTDDYIIHLEKLSRQWPTEQGIRDLYAQYEAKAQPEKQLQTLARMVNLYRGKANDYVTLAYLQANNHDFTSALKTLATLESKHPNAASPEKEELHISLFLDAGKPDRAKDRVSKWLNRKFDPMAFARFLDIFKSKQNDQLGLQLLKNYETPVEQDANLLRLLVELEIQAGESRESLARLVRLFRTDRLPDSLAFNLIELVMEPGKKAKPLMTGPIQKHLTAENYKLAKDVLNKYGEAFLSPRPLLAARLMLALDRETSALRWVQTAENMPLLTLDQEIELASLYGKLERSGKIQRTFDTTNLRNRILLELQAPSLPGTRRMELVYAMLELRAHRQALPHLKQLAYQLGGDWIYPYEETLKKLGRNQEVIDFWRMRIKQSGLPVEEKRQLAFQLLESNSKTDALNVFRELAETAPAQSADVEQLLFLWGPRPAKADQKWLADRAKASKGKERAEWLKHLINTGGAKEALLLTAMTSPAETTDQQFAVHLLALGELHDNNDFAAKTLQSLKSEKNSNRLLRYATLAEDREQSEVVQAAYTKILQVQSDEEHALRKLGWMAFQQNRWKDAQYYFGRLLNKNKQDWSANYYYAEADFSQGKITTAISYYQQSLASIDKAPLPTLPMELTRAHCLHRLGKHKEALSAYDRLLKKRPDDKEIRASIIFSLIASGNFEKAQQLIISN